MHISSHTVVDVVGMSRRATQVAPVLSLEGISKRFGGILALDEVDLQLYPGEIRALVGKNGAGKSTVVNLISGVLQPDKGRLSLHEKPYRPTSPHDALMHGVATVHQELMVVPGLSVGENVLLGNWGRHGMVSAHDVAERAARTLRILNSSLDPRQSASNLTIAEWQYIEIARALARNVQVLILDEPTSALSAVEADQLLKVVRSAAATGVCILYVSHRLDEIERIADTVTVLRDGKVVATTLSASFTRTQLVDRMVGGSGRRATAARVAQSTCQPADQGPIALSLEDLTVPNRVERMTLKLFQGEVVGLAGLVGAGPTEVLRAAFGLIPDATGRVRVYGHVIRHPAPRRMRRAGVAFATDDRKREGLFLELSVSDNISCGALESVSSGGIIRDRRCRSKVLEAIDRFDIRTSGPDQLVRLLSGGNQQKVVIASCLASQVRVLLLDEPTRGVDVEAKAQLYTLLRTLAQDGLSVLVAPSEFDEFQYLCDRVIVLRHGKIVTELRSPDLEPDRIMKYVLSA